MLYIPVLAGQGLYSVVYVCRDWCAALERCIGLYRLVLVYIVLRMPILTSMRLCSVV